MYSWNMKKLFYLFQIKMGICSVSVYYEHIGLQAPLSVNIFSIVLGFRSDIFSAWKSKHGSNSTIIHREQQR